MTRGFYVETSLGNALLPDNARYFSLIQGKTFIEKRIQDITEGELVLYRKDCIDKTLEEIEPSLEKSGRYASALWRLFIETPKGTRTPVFRRDLIRSVAPVVGISEQGLEERITGREAEFSDEEYQQMAIHLKGVLDRAKERDGTQTRSYHAIKDWLLGKTIAPSDWRIFGVLAQDVSPVFSAYTEPEDRAESYAHNYRVWKITRSAIMSYLAKYTGKTGEKSGTEESDAEDSGHMTIAPEIGIVLRDFIQDIDETTGVGRVTRIVNYDAKRGTGVKETECARLRKGIVTQDPEEKYKKRSLTQVMAENSVFNVAIVNMTYRYILEGARRKLGSVSAADKDDIHFCACAYIEFYRGKNTLEETIAKWFDESIGNFLGITGKQFSLDIDRGNIDEGLDLPNGTFAQAYEVFIRTSRLVPSGLKPSGLKLPSYRIIADEGKKEEIRKQIGDDVQKIMKRYGWDPTKMETRIKGLPEKVVISDVLLWGDKPEGISTMMNPEAVRDIAEKFPPVLTKKELSEILEAYDLSCLRRFFHPNNFILEGDVPWGA